MKINTLVHRGFDTFTHTVTDIGTLVAGFARPSQEVKMYGRVTRLIEPQTRNWPLVDRIAANDYCLDLICGSHNCFHLTPAVKQVVDSALTKAKAA